MSWTWSVWPGVLANITSNYAMLLPEDRLLDPMSPWLGGWICAIRWYTGPLKGKVYNGAHMAPLRLFSCLLHKETKLRVNTFYGHALHSFGEWTVNFHALQKKQGADIRQFLVANLGAPDVWQRALFNEPTTDLNTNILRCFLEEQPQIPKNDLHLMMAKVPSMSGGGIQYKND